MDEEETEILIRYSNWINPSEDVALRFSNIATLLERSILIDNRIDSNDSCDDIGKSLRTLFARITGSTESITLIRG